jgi:phage shock protein PspC (stress-responsive transcriptional regulator)
VKESKTGSSVVDWESTPEGAPPLDRREKPPARLYRSRSDRMVGGVCGGLGHYFNLDPVWIRLAFVLLALGGAGVLAYLILWVVIPERPLTEPEPAITAKGESRTSQRFETTGVVDLPTILGRLSDDTVYLRQVYRSTGPMARLAWEPGRQGESREPNERRNHPARPVSGQEDEPGDKEDHRHHEEQESIREGRQADQEHHDHCCKSVKSRLFGHEIHLPMTCCLQVAPYRL